MSDDVTSRAIEAVATTAAAVVGVILGRIQGKREKVSEGETYLHTRIDWLSEQVTSNTRRLDECNEKHELALSEIRQEQTRYYDCERRYAELNNEIRRRVTIRDAERDELLARLESAQRAINDLRHKLPEEGAR